MVLDGDRCGARSNPPVGCAHPRSWLPPSCRRARIIEVGTGTDLALDRWCEIGLLAAAPLADEYEVRFVLRGNVIPEIRTPADSV